jgi:hypothetical protein
MSTSWPTGPIVPASLPTAPPPQPDTYPLPEELLDPPLVNIIESCPDPDCLQCRVARIGASTICRLVGVDYDTLDRAAQAHYETVATEVMATMSEALIAWGVAVIPDEGQ